MEKEERIVILSKMQWAEFLAGRGKTLTIFNESDLHHEFGDEPEEYIIRVKISEITKD